MKKSPQSFDQNARILITGGTGFVGSHLLEYLLENNYQDVYLTTYSKASKFFIDRLSLDKIIQIDLADQEATAQMIAKIRPTHIFHLASLSAVGSSFQNLKKVLLNNILLQQSLLESVRVQNYSIRLLSVGSADVYGINHLQVEHFDIDSKVSKNILGLDENQILNPTNPYAVSKASQDLLAGYYHNAFGLDVIRVRPFNHIGERQTFDFAVPSFCQQIIAVENGRQDHVEVGNLSGIRDFSDVKDVVKAYVVLMQKAQKGEIYNIGSGLGVSMDLVLNKLASFANVKIDVKIDQNKLRPIDIPVMVANNTKLRSLGWQSEIDLDSSLERILNHYRSLLI